MLLGLTMRIVSFVWISLALYPACVLGGDEDTAAPPDAGTSPESTPKSLEDLFPEQDVRVAAPMSLEGPLFTSHPIETVAASATRALASTSAHWVLFDREGEPRARGRGRVLGASAAQDRFMVERQGSVELRSFESGDESLVFRPPTPAAAYGRIRAGGVASDDSGDFWLGWESGELEPIVTVYDRDGEKRAELAARGLRLGEDADDPWSFRVELEGGRIAVGDGSSMTAAPLVEWGELHVWADLSAPQKNLLDGLSGRVLARLPGGGGAVTVLGGIVRVYDDAGAEIDTFEADWRACAPLSSVHLACLVGDETVSVYTEGEWSTPVASASSIERLRISDRSLYLERDCTDCAPALIWYAQGVDLRETVVASRSRQTPPHAWADDGTLYLLTAAARELVREGAGTETWLLRAAFADAVSARFVAVLTGQEVHLFDRSTGQALARQTIEDEIFWDVFLQWQGDDYPGDWAEETALRVSFSSDEMHLAVLAARPDTAGDVDGTHGRHYSIWVLSTEALVLEHRFDQYHGIGGDFRGRVLRAEEAWYEPPAWESALALPSGDPSGDATHVAEMKSGQVVVRAVEGGDVVGAYADVTGFSWVDDRRLALWTPDSVTLRDVAGEGSLEVELPGGWRNFRWIPDRSLRPESICAPLRDVVDANDERHALRLRVNAETGDTFLPLAPWYEGPTWGGSWPGNHEREACRHGLFYERSDWEIATL